MRLIFGIILAATSFTGCWWDNPKPSLCTADLTPTAYEIDFKPLENNTTLVKTTYDLGLYISEHGMLRSALDYCIKVSK